ncbi:sulfite exporter TauE/SafE family protein, partial [Pectobacterium parvum]|nr:sulfite exporter TauE/SafE family protein [Pectobacterium parvum]
LKGGNYWICRLFLILAVTLLIKLLWETLQH